MTAVDQVSWVEEFAALHGLLTVRDDPEERRARMLEKVAATLAELPPLRYWHETVLLFGGWHEFARKPKTVEIVEQRDGEDVNGNPVYRRRARNLEKAVSVKVASREATLALIREMRRAGWTAEQARSIFNFDLPSAVWLDSQKDSEREFQRCWEKASVPTSELAQRNPRKAQKGAGTFVSHESDQRKVLEFVGAYPGLGTRELLRSECGLMGHHIEGRIKAALKVLIADGKVHQEPGPRNARYHFKTRT